MRDPERIPMILAALERRWREEPDLRLGQLLVNVIASNGPDVEASPLVLMEDGELLRRVGAVTEAEERYIREEPRQRREGWKAWQKGATHRDAFPKRGEMQRPGSDE